jgi:hypothetical protein
MQTVSIVHARTRFSVVAALCGMLACAAANAAYDDPPGRVARVNLLDGRGALQPEGSDTWIDDLLNRPLTDGDKLWIETDSRAEMHIGSMALRLGARTALQVVRIDDRSVRLRLTAGALSVRIRALDDDERFDIETPAGEVSLLQPGGYRLDVDDREERAHVAVWSGRAEVSGRSGTSIVRSDESAELLGGDTPAIELAAAGATDGLDRWAEDRDRREDQSRAARYVSRDVVGYEELDGYGDWVVDPVYGSVWVPQVVAVGWAPYRFGYWSWIGPWGWTWIDDAPWGFAPCHYGRWIYARHGWAWAPGARRELRPVYAPALVAWRGDRYPRHEGDRDHAPRVGWVPLGYNEVYEPPFRASHDYLRAANLSNTHLGHTDIERYIGERQRGGDQRPERRYVNERVPGAYTEVSHDTFTSALPVGRNRLQAPVNQSPQAPLSARPPDIRPEPRSIGRALSTDRPAPRPNASIFGRPVMSAGGRLPAPQREPRPVEPPAPRLRELAPAGHAQGSSGAQPIAPRPPERIERNADRPIAPPARTRAERDVERPAVPPTRLRIDRTVERAPPPSRYSPPPGAAQIERGERPVRPPTYSAPPAYRAPQSAPPAPAVHAAPAPAAPAVNRGERYGDRGTERGNRDQQRR